MLDWEPLRNPATSYTLYSRLMEGITYLEHTALGVSLDSRPTEGAPCLEPLEQSVLSSSLAVRPVEGITNKVSDWKSVINPVISYTLDSQLMEGIAYLECSALGCLWTVDLRRGRRVWNHWSSRFLVRRSRSVKIKIKTKIPYYRPLSIAKFGHLHQKTSGKRLLFPW